MISFLWAQPCNILVYGSFPSEMSGHSKLLASIISTATAADPDDRYQDVNLMKDALVSFLSTNERNHSYTVIGIVVVSVVLLIISIVLFVFL